MMDFVSKMILIVSNSCDIARRYFCLVIDEYLTSQRCPICADWMSCVYSHTERFKNCPHDRGRNPMSQNKVRKMNELVVVAFVFVFVFFLC